MIGEALGLHVGEVQSETHMRAAAIRHECVFVPAARVLFGESQGIEGSGSGQTSGM